VHVISKINKSLKFAMEDAPAIEDSHYHSEDQQSIAAALVKNHQ
jgi:hypothetical protein